MQTLNAINATKKPKQLMKSYANMKLWITRGNQCMDNGNEVQKNITHSKKDLYKIVQVLFPVLLEWVSWKDRSKCNMVAVLSEDLKVMDKSEGSQKEQYKHLVENILGDHHYGFWNKYTLQIKFLLLDICWKIII